MTNVEKAKYTPPTRQAPTARRTVASFVVNVNEEPAVPSSEHD
jgi:hypothetical protein